MKKFLILLFVCLFVLSGCAKEDLDSNPSSKINYCKHDDPSQIVVVEEVAPTCQQTGLTEGMRCNICGVMVIPQTIVPTTICSRNVLIVDKAATKTEDGYQHWECAACGDIKSTEIIYAGSQGLDYGQRVDGAYCKVLGIGSCQDVDLVIPKMYNGMPVELIGDGAFSQCTLIKSIVIPEGVIAIGHQAFWNCSALESIIIPHSVWRIDGIAFTGCTSLSSIYYDGTMEEWDAIGRNTGWNICSHKVTIYCTDGQISN